MIISYFKDDVRDRMRRGLIRIVKIDEVGSDGNRARIHARDENRMSITLDVENPQTSNEDFDYSDSFIADVRVLRYIKHYGNVVFKCAYVKVCELNNTDNFVEITEG